MIRAHSICMLMVGWMISFTISADTSINNDHIDTKEKSIPTITVIETGYLEAKPGYTGDVIGAEVENITINEERNLQIIDINVPIYLDEDDIDRVKVFSKSGKPIPQNKEAEIFNDYENNNVGIKLYLPKKNVGFKLKLIDESDSNSDSLQ